VDLSGSGYNPVVVICEHGYELYGLIASRSAIVNVPPAFFYRVTNRMALYCAFQPTFLSSKKKAGL
jgi:hypothetical protein